MTVRKAAERLEVSQSTVYALIAAGKLKCHRVGVGRGCIRIHEDHIAAYLAAGEQTALTPPPAVRTFQPRHIKIS